VSGFLKLLRKDDRYYPEIRPALQTGIRTPHTASQLK
jgi:hypothetical protein